MKAIARNAGRVSRGLNQLIRRRTARGRGKGSSRPNGGSRSGPLEDERLRVALVAPRFPPDVGGLETYVGWVARAVNASPSCEIVVITTSASRHSSEERYHGIRVIRLATWWTLSNTPINPLWFAQLRRVIRSLDIDVINVHSPVPGLADIATIISGPIPVVMTYHAGSLLKGGGIVDVPLRAYERYVLPRVFAKCTKLIAVSPVSTAHATGRAELIPPGVDSNFFVPPDFSETREQRVLYVGRVERTSRWKGIQVLIAALPRLQELVPDVKLDVIGDGDDVPHLQGLAAQRGVGDRIVWHGKVDHSRLPYFYHRAAVLVLPSLTESESFGITLVEAMASGCPVVGSRVGGIPFVIRDEVDGLLVPPGDHAALADALVFVLGDRVRADEMGKAGRQAAEAQWDWERQRDRTLSVLREAARANM